jgi:hypothetical protein
MPAHAPARLAIELLMMATPTLIAYLDRVLRIVQLLITIPFILGGMDLTLLVRGF